jgi:hypothetical protein
LRIIVLPQSACHAETVWINPKSEARAALPHENRFLLKVHL